MSRSAEAGDYQTAHTILEHLTAPELLRYLNHAYVNGVALSYRPTWSELIRSAALQASLDIAWDPGPGQRKSEAPF
jgi:hypothetical protein